MTNLRHRMPYIHVKFIRKSSMVIVKYMPHGTAIMIHVGCVTIQCLLVNFLKAQIINLRRKMSCVFARTHARKNC